MTKKQYYKWIQKFDTYNDHDISIMKELSKKCSSRPIISLIVKAQKEHKHLSNLVHSVLEQTYDNWELLIPANCNNEKLPQDERIVLTKFDSNSHMNDIINISSGQFVAFVGENDLLSVHSLFCIVSTINNNPDVDYIYSDEDFINEKGHRFNPFFKPDWDICLLHHRYYTENLSVLRKSVISDIGGLNEKLGNGCYYDLILRASAVFRKVCHLPYILYHFREKTRDYKGLRDALYNNIGQDYEIIPIKGTQDSFITEHKSKNKPLVSIIIPTKDRLKLLKNCIDGIIDRTDYDNYEVIVVNNNSSDKMTIDYLNNLKESPKFMIIDDCDDFNYSRLNNEAVESSNGELLLFLNNDIKIIKPDWLSKIVSRFENDNVGAVGVKLLYKNENIQHAGVALGIYEVAGHMMRHFKRHDTDNNSLVNLERKVSAVTAACMAVPKTVFQKAGGFDEEKLSVSYNDIDLCIKIGNLGYDIIYSPSIELYHLESQSRGFDLTPEQKELSYKERRQMLLKYGKKLCRDPFYNPNLTLVSEGMNLSDVPRIGKMWYKTIEFVSPPSIRETTIGFQIACMMAQRGMQIRMHVPSTMKETVELFDKNENVFFNFIDIRNKNDTDRYYEKMIEIISRKADSSNLIIIGRPQREIEKTSMNYVENILFNYGFNIDDLNIPDE